MPEKFEYHVVQSYNAGELAEEVERRLREGWELVGGIRRAMTNLADDGLLFKSGETRTGIYGKQAHVYYFVKKR